jgi:hypothetical protein
MQYTIIALGVALAVLGMSLWWARKRSASRESLEARCRRDIAALRRTSHSRSPGFSMDDIWSAGAEAVPAQSHAKKSVSWLAIGTAGVSCGGCGGCGGCGCGG